MLDGPHTYVDYPLPPWDPPPLPPQAQHYLLDIAGLTVGVGMFATMSNPPGLALEAAYVIAGRGVTGFYQALASGLNLLSDFSASPADSLLLRDATAVFSLGGRATLLGGGFFLGSKDLFLAMQIGNTIDSIFGIFRFRSSDGLSDLIGTAYGGVTAVLNAPSQYRLLEKTLYEEFPDWFDETTEEKRKPERRKGPVGSQETHDGAAPSSPSWNQPLGPSEGPIIWSDNDNYWPGGGGVGGGAGADYDKKLA